MKKIAIFHDYFDEIGGAELTLLQLARVLKASIFTTNINFKHINQLGFQDVPISSIGKIPNIPRIKPLLAQGRFSLYKNPGFDLYLLSGYYTTVAAAHHSPNIWYCFSPQRGLYDLRYFYQRNAVIQNLKEILIKIDRDAQRNVQAIIVPSKRIQERVAQYYQRPANVIHSPVDVKMFYHAPHENYWLSVTRITPHKRLELQIEAFNEMPEEKLIIIGWAPCGNKAYLDKLKSCAPANIHFQDRIFCQKELARYYAFCKGFITTAQEEDFGKTPIEAMASGKPVIAPNEGGFPETILNGITGLLIEQINSDKIKDAVKDINKNPERFKEACLSRAKLFSLERYTAEIQSFLGT